MPGTAPRRTVVFDRIASNRRKTLLLTGVSGIALIPVVGWLSSYLPFWVFMFLPGLMNFTREGRTAVPVYVGLAVIIALGLLTVALCLQYRYADRIALRMARARPLGRDREKRLRDAVEGLCLGVGLPLPKLYVVETEVPNAFSVGLDPARSSLVVTRGLLSLLPPRELEAVLAHEISHIGNQDIRLNTMVMAMRTVLQLPFRLLTAPFRFLFHIHWLLGAGALLLLARMFLLLPDFGETLRTFDELDPTGRLRTLAVVQATVILHAFLVAPLVGLLFPLAVSRQRELLADADAALLIHDPAALARALARIAGAGNGPFKGSHAMAHLFIAEPPGPVRWWKGMLSAHPPIAARIDLLAAMGDGILPETGKGNEVEEDEVPRIPATPETPAGTAAIQGGEPGVGFLDAALFGIAVGAAAIAVLTVANSVFLLLGSGDYRLGTITGFGPAAALAAGFAARKRGTSGSIALGFALLVFLFQGILLAPLLPFMPNPDRSPLQWIVWSLGGEFAVVVVTGVAGASLDRWSRWAKLFVKGLPGRAG